MVEKIPNELDYELVEKEITLPSFEPKYKAQTVKAEVMVHYRGKKPVEANVVSVMYNDMQVKDLVLSGWDEYEIIEKVMGDGFIESLLS